MKTLEKLFPQIPRETVLENVQRYWDLEPPLPVPRNGLLVCPHCRATFEEGRLHVRYWNFHESPTDTYAGRSLQSPHPWRCSIWFKCTLCSYAFCFGLVVSQEYWEASPRRMVYHREGKRLLEAYYAEKAEAVGAS